MKDRTNPKKSSTKKTVVPLHLKVEDTKYLPGDDHKAFVRVNPDLNGWRGVNLTSRTQAVLDLGFEIELPESWKVGVELSREWSARGLVLATPAFVDGSVVRIVLGNIGKEIILIKDGDCLGTLFPVERPSFAFTHEVKEKA